MRKYHYPLPLFSGKFFARYSSAVHGMETFEIRCPTSAHQSSNGLVSISSRRHAPQTPPNNVVYGGGFACQLCLVLLVHCIPQECYYCPWCR
eukprot:3942888-Pyramimonas_sp.AAC.1